MHKYTNNDIEAMFSGRRIPKNVVLDEVKSPSVVDTDFIFDNYQLVGHCEQTNEKCGTFCKFMGCTRVELHNKVIFDKSGNPVDCSGLGDFKPVYYSCGKPTCSVCYERGWAVREAKNIEFRLEQARKHFGSPEHITCSVPPELYGLSLKAMREKVKKVLLSRGVIGAVRIFHWVRFDKVKRVWRRGVHWHCLGFIVGGFRRCRRCSKKGRFRCNDCDGFKGRQVRGYAKDRFIVKVHDERKTIVGTAWYVLNHATVDVTKKRFHVATWFGVVSYRKLKISKELRKEWDKAHGLKCRICGLPYVRHGYCGHNVRIIALIKKRRGVHESVKRFFDRASDWKEEVGKRKWDSDS